MEICVTRTGYYCYMREKCFDNYRVRGGKITRSIDNNRRRDRAMVIDGVRTNLFCSFEYNAQRVIELMKYYY